MNKIVSTKKGDFEMKQSDREYLETQLQSAKLQLKEQETQYRIFLAVYEKERKMLNEKIDSIESQLQNK